MLKFHIKAAIISTGLSVSGRSQGVRAALSEQARTYNYVRCSDLHVPRSIALIAVSND